MNNHTASKTHTLIIIPLACCLLMLTGCGSPEIVRAPQITAAPVLTAASAPTASLPAMPSKVVTLSNDTPLPVTLTPPPASTSAIGPLVTLKGEGSVNLRSGPGPLYPLVGRAASGAQFVALARSEHGEWLLLADPAVSGGQAWVFAAYTDYNPDLHPLPVATPLQPAPSQ